MLELSAVDAAAIAVVDVISGDRFISDNDREGESLGVCEGRSVGLPRHI